MKLSDKPGELEKKGVEQLKKYYPTYEKFALCSMTWMSALSMLMEFLTENYHDKLEELPHKTRYGMALAMYHYNVLGMMIRGDIKPEGFQMKYLRVEEDAWQDRKLEERYVMIVKELYKALKEEGRL